jgi:hypothetical protein
MSKMIMWGPDDWMGGTRYVDCGGGRGVGLKPGCPEVDSEGRHVCEPLGFYTFALLPKRCRNGKVRWLCSVEAHPDGTYTLGNRAH